MTPNESQENHAVEAELAAVERAHIMAWSGARAPDFFSHLATLESALEATCELYCSQQDWS